MAVSRFFLDGWHGMDDIIIFGAGKAAVKQRDWAVFAGYQVLFYVDNDSKKWGKTIEGISVYPPEVLKGYNCTIAFPDAYRKEIDIQLEEISYEGHKITYTQLKKEAVCRKESYFKFPKRRCRKEVCFIFDTYFSGLNWGGVESWSCMVSQGLSDLGVRTCLFCGSNPRFDDISDCCIHFTDENELALVKRMAEKIVEFLPCVFISHGSVALYAAGMVKSMFPDQLRLVAVAHGDEVNTYNRLSIWSDQVDGIICISKKIYNKFQIQYGLPQDILLYKPNPIQIPQLIEKGNSAKHTLKIGFAARLRREQKRAHLLPEIIEGCISKNLDVEFNIAGEGECLEHLLAYVSDEHLEERVHVMGWIAPTDIMNFWGEQDVYLNISNYEGMSIAMLEAMALGVVPVVTDVSGVGDLIEDGRNGFVVPVENWMDVVDKIEFISENRGIVEKIGSYNKKLIRIKCDLHDYAKWLRETFCFKPSVSAE